MSAIKYRMLQARFGIKLYSYNCNWIIDISVSFPELLCSHKHTDVCAHVSHGLSAIAVLEAFHCYPVPVGNPSACMLYMWRMGKVCNFN